VPDPEWLRRVWQSRQRIAVLAYGGLNAVLYAGLLPLWDGFDEPFHYAYVQQLWQHHQPPVFGQSTLSSEVWDSLALAPGSHLVKRNVPTVTSFDEYFSRSESERVRLRQRLEHLDPRTATVPSESPNYEAQQPPLAYAILAVFDWAWRKTPLLFRVLRLRLICGVVSTLATGMLTFKLAGQLGLGERWRLSAVYLVFSSQMFYASTAHVANDWLSIPMFTLLLVTAISLQTDPKITTAGLLFTVVAAGLLTKAYFLALVPFAMFLAGWLCHTRKLFWGRVAIVAAMPLTIAGAWYARNIALYHDLSGMQQTIGGGVPIRRLVHTFPHLPWARVIDQTATSSLWTGNNSATTFSTKTVYFMLLLLLTAVFLYSRRTFWKRPRAAEWLLITALLSYGVALLYCIVLLYSPTGEALLSPPPWYVQVLLPPGMCLCMLGVQENRRLGEAVRIAMLSLWAYLISATYLAKLIPLYAGYTERRIHLFDLLRWYTQSFDKICRTLSTITMISSTALWLLAALAIAGSIGIAAMLAMPDRRGPKLSR
jgi:hypothetical protein